MAKAGKHRLGANKNQGSKWLTKKKRQAIYTRDEFTCVWCGDSPKPEYQLKLTVDHLIPRSRGGCNHPANLITSCLSCNSRRGNRTASEFIHCAAPRILARLLRAIDGSHRVPGFHRPRKTKL